MTEARIAPAMIRGDAILSLHPLHDHLRDHPQVYLQDPPRAYLQDRLRDYPLDPPHDHLQDCLQGPPVQLLDMAAMERQLIVPVPEFVRPD